MRAITTLIVSAMLLVIALLISIPVMDQLIPLVTDMTAAKYDSTLSNIHVVLVKWVVPVFLGSATVYAIFWILRDERQTVR